MSHVAKAGKSGELAKAMSRTEDPEADSKGQYVYIPVWFRMEKELPEARSK